MRATFLAAALILIGCPIGQCFAGQATIALTPLKVMGNFEGAKKSEVAVDISGISCLAPKDGKRTCLLVNDENKNAQFATLEKDELTVGQTVKLIGKDPSPDTLGKAPKATCKEDDGFKDLDGEGVAYAEPYFYVTGSHGCSRKSDKFRLSSFILARVGADLSQEATTTYRVSELPKKSDKVAPFFGKDLETENGLNVEGIATIGDTLWVGLRAPVTDDAYLVYGSISELFRAGHEPAVTAVHTVGLKLDGRGIRDLAPLPDGRLLVLAGPAQSADQSFKLYIADPATGTKEELGTLETISQKVDGEKTTGKAEGLTVLDMGDHKATFVVVFDALTNGAPHRGDVALPH
jgi:hypothetical protein